MHLNDNIVLPPVGQYQITLLLEMYILKLLLPGMHVQIPLWSHYGRLENSLI